MNHQQRNDRIKISSEGEHKYKPLSEFYGEAYLWEKRNQPYRILMATSAYDDVMHHSLSNNNREVGGILLGYLYSDNSSTSYIGITHYLPAAMANEKKLTLTFTQETWLQIDEDQEKIAPDALRVGWAHTHPTYGVFLSQPMDEWIHQSWFSQPWQLALVIDSVHMNAGFFLRDTNGVLPLQKATWEFNINAPAPIQLQSANQDLLGPDQRVVTHRGIRIPQSNLVPIEATIEAAYPAKVPEDSSPSAQDTIESQPSSPTIVETVQPKPKKHPQHRPPKKSPTPIQQRSLLEMYIPHLVVVTGGFISVGMIGMIFYFSRSTYLEEYSLSSFFLFVMLWIVEVLVIVFVPALKLNDATLKTPILYGMVAALFPLVVLALTPTHVIYYFCLFIMILSNTGLFSYYFIQQVDKG